MTMCHESRILINPVNTQHIETNMTHISVSLGSPRGWLEQQTPQASESWRPVIPGEGVSGAHSFWCSAREASAPGLSAGRGDTVFSVSLHIVFYAASVTTFPLVIRYWSSWTENHFNALIWTWLSLSSPLLQMRSHSEVLEDRIPTWLFWEDTIPYHAWLLTSTAFGREDCYFNCARRVHSSQSFLFVLALLA